jgi:hypothetical protein
MTKIKFKTEWMKEENMVQQKPHTTEQTRSQEVINEKQKIQKKKKKKKNFIDLSAKHPNPSARFQQAWSN